MNGPYGLPGFRPHGGENPLPFEPGGYLSLVSGVTAFATDQIAKTVVYYTQDKHNFAPLMRGSTRVATYFDEPKLVLTAAHLANTIYDVFLTQRDGKGDLVTGAAWSNSGAGTGDRGAGQAKLTREGGLIVNAYGVPGLQERQGLYVGSILIDASAGQITCHKSYGQSRRWGVWNYYNRRPLYLKAGDSTASWAYTTATIRASNNNSANSLVIFAGLADESFDIQFHQKIAAGNAGSSAVTSGANAIGLNSTTAASGMSGKVGVSNSAAVTTIVHGTGVARLVLPPALGASNVHALEVAVDATGTMSWFGTESDMLLAATWRG